MTLTYLGTMNSGQAGYILLKRREKKGERREKGKEEGKEVSKGSQERRKGKERDKKEDQDGIETTVSILDCQVSKYLQCNLSFN